MNAIDLDSLGFNFWLPFSDLSWTGCFAQKLTKKTALGTVFLRDWSLSPNLLRKAFFSATSFFWSWHSLMTPIQRLGILEYVLALVHLFSLFITSSAVHVLTSSKLIPYFNKLAFIFLVSSNGRIYFPEFKIFCTISRVVGLWTVLVWKLSRISIFILAKARAALASSILSCAPP